MTTTTEEEELLGVVLTPRQIWELLDLLNDAPGDADEDHAPRREAGEERGGARRRRGHPEAAQFDARPRPARRRGRARAG